MTPRAMLCARCRRLIGSDETVCSWCGARRPSSRWGAGAWRSGLPGDWWLRSIITANVLFYILSVVPGLNRGASTNLLRVLAPQDTMLLLLGATGTIPIDQFGRVWTLVSANYLHGGILHLLFNLMALRQIAPWVTLEFGASRMFVIYTLGGIGGYVISYAASIPFTIGASAAVCALIGALLYFGRSRGGAYGGMVFREVSGWVIGLFLFGLIIPAINNWGHGGGIVSGMILGMMLGYTDRRPETMAHHLLALLCAVLTAAVLAWATLGAFTPASPDVEQRTVLSREGVQ